MSYIAIVLEKLAKFFRGLLFWHAQYKVLQQMDMYMMLIIQTDAVMSVC